MLDGKEQTKKQKNWSFFSTASIFKDVVLWADITETKKKTAVIFTIKYFNQIREKEVFEITRFK